MTCRKAHIMQYVALGVRPASSVRAVLENRLMRRTWLCMTVFQKDMQQGWCMQQALKGTIEKTGVAGVVQPGADLVALWPCGGYAL